MGYNWPMRESSELPLPLLITGIAGVAGYNALNYFQERYPGQVIGIRQEDNWPLSGPGIVACNAEDRGALERLFDQHQFRAVLNCAGNCALKSCELDSRLAWRTNVEGMITLLSIVVERQVRLVHTSIDLVFAGRDEMPLDWPGYTEQDRTDPVTVYGTTMVAAEQLLLDNVPGACGLRISLPMGVSFNGHAGAIDWIQSRFAKGRPATLYYDEVRTPTYTDCLEQCVRNAARQQRRGTLSRRRTATIVALSDRAGDQPGRWLRSELADGLPANRSRSDPTSRGQCDDGFIEAHDGTRLSTVRSLAVGSGACADA